MPISTAPILSSANNSASFSDSKPLSNSKINFELSEPFYDMSDLVLPENTKSELNRAIALRQFQKEVFEHWGFSTTHKFDNKMIINLYGEPGTGKTMAAHAIAKSLNKKIR